MAPGAANTRCGRRSKAAGVQQLGELTFGYNAATERLDIPLVRVRKPDGTVIDTPSTSIRELSPPLERIAPVYTDLRQKQVSVQALRPGDTLEIRVITTIHTPLAPGHFWAELGFDDADIVLDEQLELDVPAETRMLLKLTPGLDPAFTQANGRRLYHWTHSHATREGDKARAANEKNRASTEPEWAAVRLTTFTDWREVGEWFSALERPARQPNAEIRDKARQLTEGRTTDLARIEALYDYVSKNFRYVSLSLGAGRYQPRAAADVMRDAYGDCKDKHTLLAALLDAAGLPAVPVLINSQRKIDPEFPSPSQFDHVITLARAGGEDVWLDATPEVAPFRLLSYGLRARQGLVASAGSVALKSTPADPPMPSLVRTEVRGSLSDAGTLSADVRLTFRADLELALRITFRGTPKPRWLDLVTEMTRAEGLSGTLSALEVSDPQATNAPFSIAFHVDAPGYADLAGRKIDLALPLAGDAPEQSVEEPSTVNPIEIGTPGETAYSLTLSVPAAARLRAAVPVDVTRDYAAYHASYVVGPGTLRVDRVMASRQRDIPPARRADFLAFKRVLEADARQKVSLDGTAVVAPAVASDAKAHDLHVSGYAALQAGDHARAVDLLTRAVAADPKLSGARVNLADAHLRLHEPEAALAVLRAQVEVNPYEQWVYFYMGRAYVALHRYTEAEAAFLKQLEIDPLDKYTPAALGAMYLEQRQFEKAAQAFEKAVAVNPDQAYAQTQLGKAYLNLRRVADARQAFARAVELAPTAATWNSVAYELALAGIDLDLAQRYAESAVSAQSAASRNLDVEHADARALAIVSSLASYWDTLGWVAFARHDLPKAEKYVTAAWNLGQHAEVGDHLGQIYEKTGRAALAVGVYAQSVAAIDASAEVREHLAAAAGGAANAEKAVAAHREELARARTMTLPGRGPAGKKGEFFILFGPPGIAEAVSFIEGDAAVKDLTTALHKVKIDNMFPDETPARLLRRGIVGCSDAGVCSLILLLPQDATPAR